MIGNDIRFSKKSEAETAIAHLHGHFFQGLALFLFSALMSFHSRSKQGA